MGRDKETILTMFKAIGRVIIDYTQSSPWTPQLSDISWTKLQTKQSTAMRIATGSHLMAHQNDLHNKTKLLPVKQYIISSCPDNIASDKTYRTAPCNEVENGT